MRNACSEEHSRPINDAMSMKPRWLSCTERNQSNTKTRDERCLLSNSFIKRRERKATGVSDEYYCRTEFTNRESTAQRMR